MEKRKGEMNFAEGFSKRCLAQAGPRPSGCHEGQSRQDPLGSALSLLPLIALVMGVSPGTISVAFPGAHQKERPGVAVPRQRMEEP